MAALKLASLLELASMLLETGALLLELASMLLKTGGLRPKTVRGSQNPPMFGILTMPGVASAGTAPTGA